MKLRRLLLMVCLLAFSLWIITTNHSEDVDELSTVQQEHGLRSYLQKENRKDVELPSSMLLGHRKSASAHTQKGMFLYYVQSASCLWDRYLQPDMLGDASKCRCKVLVLSYKSHCQNNTFQHIRYIDSFNSTWTIGRNELYRKARQVIDNYSSFLYHTFLDEDLSFTWLHPRYIDKLAVYNISTSPMRAYENFLIERNPAVGGPFYTYSPCLGINPSPSKLQVYTFVKAATGSTKGLERGHFLPETGLIIHMDAAVVSYHHTALDTLLPYEDSFEKRSHWISQQSMIVRMYVKYRGQSIAYFPVGVCNGGSHPYPKGVIPYKELFEYERSVAPVRLKNHQVWNVTDALFLTGGNPVFNYKAPPFGEFWNPKMVPYLWLA